MTRGRSGPMRALRWVLHPSLPVFPLLAALTASSALAAPAAAPSNQPAAQPDPAVLSLARFGQGIERLTIENGLRLVLAPTAAPDGRSVGGTGSAPATRAPVRGGFRALVEHMMSKAASTSPRGNTSR